MLYENNICMACSDKFNEGDDIVVCPVCGTPQHRRCWEERGRCVNELRHGEGYVWSAPGDGAGSGDSDGGFDPKAQVGIVCPNCGTNCPQDALVCRECGTPFGAPRPNPFTAAWGNDADLYFMRGVSAEPDDLIDGIPVREAAMYVRVRARKYIPRFIRASASGAGRKTGWNWSAFIFAPFWFFYRKIYRTGSLFLGGALVLMMFMSILLAGTQTAMYDAVTKHISVTSTTTMADVQKELANLSDEDEAEVMAAISGYGKALALTFAVMFLPNIPAALFADRIYMNKLRRDYAAMKRSAPDEKIFRMMLMRRGGVSYFSMFGSYMLVSAFLNMALYI